MSIDFTTLCDAAVETNGRLNILGTIEAFWTPRVPYIHPKCMFAARLRWNGDERTKVHHARILVVDGDGYCITDEFHRVFPPPEAVAEDVPLLRHILIDLVSLRFASYGPYAVIVEVDGEQLASLPFSVVARIREGKQRSSR